MLESVSSFVMDKFKIERKKAALYSTLAIFVVGGVFASLSNGPLDRKFLFGDNFLDFF